MENNTFQQRIKEKAESRLKKDLLEASGKLQSVGNLIGHDFSPLLDVWEHYNYSNKSDIVLKNDSSKEIFEKLLPRYISNVTDDILQKIDEIDWLLENKNQQANDY